MSNHFKLFAMLIAIAIISACGTTETATTTVSEPHIPNPTPTAQEIAGITRTVLTYNELMHGFISTSPVEEDALTIPKVAAPPASTFGGRLELLGEDTVGEMLVLRGDPSQEP